MSKVLPTLFQKAIALPSDHGSWVFLFSPLLIGMFAAGSWPVELWFLLIGLLAVFFLRQPASIAVKILSKRRSRQAFPAAIFWLVVYGSFGLVSLFLLARSGFSYLLWLTIPGFLVFAWHLWLVSRREERYQMGIDIIASGVLALSAPAAYWVCLGSNSGVGWLLWILSWLQSAASIVYAFLRLAQRRLTEMPSRTVRLEMGRRALLYSSFNFLLSVGISIVFQFSAWIWIPFTIQLAESIWGTTHPAIGQKPTSIGIRQLVISTIFTLVFITIWNI